MDRLYRMDRLDRLYQLYQLEWLDRLDPLDGYYHCLLHVLPLHYRRTLSAYNEINLADKTDFCYNTLLPTQLYSTYNLKEDLLTHF